MKPIRKAICALILLLITPKALHPALAAPPSYLLTCRGGPFPGFVWNDSSSELQVTFIPGTGPASDGVSPGQCTWSDRAIDTNIDPYRFCISTRVVAAWTAPPLQGPPDHWHVLFDVKNFAKPGAGSPELIMQALSSQTLNDPTMWFYLYVHKEGAVGGCLRIDRVGP
jgi:hypothetical protein